MPGSLADLIPSRPRRQMSVRQIGFGGSAQSTSGSSEPTVRSISSDDNLLTTDQYLLVDATSDVDLALDTPTGTRAYYLKITAGAGVLTLTPVSGTIDGGADYSFSGDQASIGLLFDGTNWQTFLS